MSGNESDGGTGGLNERSAAPTTSTRADVGKMSADEVTKLAYELQVHQVELEAQNQELRQTQQQLTEARDWYHELYEFSPVGCLTLDTAGVIISANLSAASLLGVDRNTLTGQKFASLVALESRDAALLHLRTVDAEPLKHSCELKLNHNLPHPRDIKIESVPHVEGGRVVGYRTTLTEITNFKETQSRLENLNEELDEAVRERTRELADQRDFNQTVIDTVRAVILVLDAEGYIVSFNHFMEKISGYTLAEVRGKKWSSTFLTERDRVWSEELLENAADGTPFQRFTNAIVTKAGQERDIEWQDAELRDADGKLKGLLLTGHDVTERQSLQQQLVTISEKEQQRIGAQLHDDLGQEMVALSLIADTLVDDLRDHGSLDVDRAIQLSEGLGRAVSSIRELSHGLVRFTVNSEHLVSEVQRLCSQLRDFENTNCACNVETAIAVPNDQVATQLYHIAKEAVANALKHARVDGLRTRINLYADGDEIVLEVGDNGVGISDDDLRQRRGSGLRIMRRRARVIGGTLKIESHPEGGTLVVCRVPQEREDNP